LLQLTIKNINKTYNNNIHALKNISLDITTGILGLLGPNGAGKSTLLKIISTIMKPDSGELYLNGVNIVKKPNKMREILGYLPQDFGVYRNLNAVEFLNYIASLKGIDTARSKNRILKLLEYVNLYEYRNRPLSSYSGGMLQRIGIAQAFLNDPKVLIFDEPTVGLDPEERVNFRNMLANISTERIIILSTHIVSDIEAVANKIAIMNNGLLIRYSTPEELLSEISGKVCEINISSEEFFRNKNDLIVSNSIQRTDGILARVVGNNTTRYKGRPVSPKLEDAYLYLIKSNFGD